MLFKFKSVYCGALVALGISNMASASVLNLAHSPLYVAQSVPPMVMLVMGRDHTLYYSAYNDAADLTGDGQLNINYSPDQVDYYGYFDSHKCYSYSNQGRFEPKSITNNKKCSQLWSGDFLNYLTMSRMDVLRKVLYGGYRSSDSDSETVLERVFVPRDGHSWAKSYHSVAVNGYDLREYSPLSLPSSNRQHFFGNASFSHLGAPELHIARNQYNGVWVWASSERPVLDNRTISGSISSSDKLQVRVQVCNSQFPEENCVLYPNGNLKPSGLLHEYGESGAMDFGLLTGSYDNNLSGGRLRQNVDNFAREVDLYSGRFNSQVSGIVDTINRLRIHGFNYTGSGSNYTYTDNCSWIANRAISDGECASWGNPLGEMLYESLRYFYGEKSPSSSYVGKTRIDDSLGLPRPQWDDPFASREYCAVPHNLVISDISPSYDSDQLPGSSWGSYNGSRLPSFSISELLQKISSAESIAGNYFVGESLNHDRDSVGAPTAKQVDSLNTIRGLAPQEPTKEGSYSSAGVAYYGLKNDMFPQHDGHFNIKTSVVALSSQLPEISVNVDGQSINLVPFAKSVQGNYGGTISPQPGNFQPTNTIVDYYIQSFDQNSGTFRINFEDVEQGADHDMDMVVLYNYSVEDALCPYPNDNPETCHKRRGLRIELVSEYAEGSIVQHAGYVVSGSDHDGIYLDVSHKNRNKEAYYLDTPEQQDRPYPNNSRNRNNNKNTEKLPDQRVRHFFPSTKPAEFLPSPLWYAAKWGGFEDKNGNFLPDAGEWDSNNDGNPDAFFPVTNAADLSKQLGKALDRIVGGKQSATPPVFSNIFLNVGTSLYQSFFDSENWSGDVRAYPAANHGFSPDHSWSAAENLDALSPDKRRIFTRNDQSQNVFRFTTDNLPRTEIIGNSNRYSFEQLLAMLDGYSGSESDKLQHLNRLVGYIRGERDQEGSEADGKLRQRSSVLGDIVNSTPYLVAEINGHKVNRELLVFGANDGMVHILDQKTGDELAAYIPSQVYSELNHYSKNTYTHRYLVDGAISGFSDKETTTVVGSLGNSLKGMYAIDVSNMSSPTESHFLWEISPKGDYAGIGHITAAPTIAELNNGQVGVIFSNGYNAGDDQASLYIANIKDGSLIAKISTGVGSNDDPSGQGRPNALANPAVIDLTGNGIADRVYAGDLFGNMWAFDLSGSSTSWRISHRHMGLPAPLFSASSPDAAPPRTYASQAITSRPSVGVHPLGLEQGVLVAFGTGKYLEVHDKQIEGHETQSFYSIWDRMNETPVSSSRYFDEKLRTHQYDSLLRQAIAEEDSRNRRLTDYPIDWNRDQGWYLDLVNTQNDNTENYGERQVSNSLLLANKVVFTTLLPNDNICSAGGSGWYMEVDLHNGHTWNKGSEAGLDPNDPENTIPDDSSNQKVDGIPSAPGVIVDPNPPSEDGEALPPGKVVEKVCITLSDGSLFCFDDEKNPTGRLSWQDLF